MDRSRYLVPLLTLLLVLPAGSALAQDGDGDLQSEAEAFAETLNDLADAIDPFSPNDGDAVGPGDVDPFSPGDGDAVDPGDVDPFSPADGDDADPGAPAEPAEPAEASEPDGIELPEPSDPEEGGFVEIFLAPDPAPRAGTWRARNKQGTVACSKIGTLTLDPTTQTGRITVRDDAKKLTGKSIFDDQSKPVNMTWDPESNRYRGKVRLAVPGGRVNMDFTLRVVSPRKMVGSLSARVTVKQGGVRGRCTVSRGLTLTRTGN